MPVRERFGASDFGELSPACGRKVNPLWLENTVRPFQLPNSNLQINSQLPNPNAQFPAPPPLAARRALQFGIWTSERGVGSWDLEVGSWNLGVRSSIPHAHGRIDRKGSAQTDRPPRHDRTGAGTGLSAGGRAGGVARDRAC